MDPGVLIVAAIAAWALWQSGAFGDTTTMGLGPGGGGVPSPGRAPGTTAQPGGGGGAGAGAGALAAPLIPLVNRLLPTLTPARAGLPQVPTPPMPNPPVYTPVDVAAVAQGAGVTVAELSAMAAEFGVAPETLAGAIQAGSGLEFANTVALVGEAQAPAAMAATGAVYVGWAIPIAAAAIVGALILRAAFSTRGSFGESKDRARAAVGRLGMAEAYRIANAVLDDLLATGRPPAAFTQEVAIRTGYVFTSWYENVDSFKDNFQGQAGGLAAYESLMVKVRAYYGRAAESQGWWAQVLNFVQQGDQTWGTQRNALGAPLWSAQAYIEEIGRQVPPPAWLRGWGDFQELASLGYAGMLNFVRQTIVDQRTAAMTAGEGGNA